VPVIGSVAILYYYFHDQDWEKFMEVCVKADLWLAIAAIFIPQFFFWFMGTVITERTIKWFHGPFPFWDYFWVRGALYILMFINPALGGGGRLLYEQRKAEITWVKLLGIYLFRGGVVAWGMGIILIPATYAMTYYGLDENIKINMNIWWGVLLSGPPGMILTWAFWRYKLDPIGLGKLITPDTEHEFWTAFREASTWQWFLTNAMLIPPIIFMWVGFYFLNLAFDVNVPFLEFIVVIPIAMLVMDLPIFLGGLGGVTLAWITYFSGHGSPDNIAALTLFLPVCRAVRRSMIGVISLSPAMKEINSLTSANAKS